MENQIKTHILFLLLLILFPVISFSQNTTINAPTRNNSTSVDPLNKYDLVYDYAEGLALVRKGYAEKSKFGYIDVNKKEVIPCIYDDASLVFSSGRSRVELDGKIFYIDKAGEQAFPQTFEMCCDFSHGLAAVKIGNRWGYINPDGEMAIPCIFYSASTHNKRGYAAVSIYEDSVQKYGMIDANGTVIIPFEYDNLRVNLYEHRNGKEAEVKRNGEVYYIDINGNRLPTD